MRSIDRKIILDLTSKNLQRAFREYGLGANDAAEALRDLFQEARSLMEREEPHHSKGVKLLQYCYEKLEAFIQHIEGKKVDIVDGSRIEELTGAQLEELVKDIQIDIKDNQVE